MLGVESLVRYCDSYCGSPSGELKIMIMEFEDVFNYNEDE